MTDPRVEEIRQRNQNRTQGEWARQAYWFNCEPGEPDYYISIDGSIRELYSSEDAEFIAHAPSDIDYLLQIADAWESLRNGPLEKPKRASKGQLIRSCHPSHFRAGEWAAIKEVFPVDNVEMYLVEFGDGVKAFWRVDDELAEYEFEEPK